MKLALIKLPSTYADWYKRPLLGLAYIAAYARNNGFECRIFDAYFHSWSMQDLLNRVKAYKPDVIGLSAMTNEVNGAGESASWLKKELNIPVIIGGCHVTALPERTLKEFPAFDYGVFGEGEKTTVELLKYLQDKKPDLHSIKGLAFRDGDSTVVNEPRPFLSSEELDALPYPAFDDYYADDPKALAARNAYYVMFSSRGCPYNCAFCMQVLGRKVRRRSPENILGEMEYAIERWGAHSFDFADEIFLFDRPETRTILQMFIDRGHPDRIKWSGLTRANLVKPDIIALAKKAGCHRLEMGVESGDDEILKATNKKITVKQVREAVRIIKDAGIPLGTYYILGHPNETRQTVQKTVDLAAELNTDTIAVGIMVPFPGTRIYDMAANGEGGYRLLTEDWSHYDKYGAQAMEIEGLPHKELLKWQKKAVLKLYIRNFRILDCLKYFWKRRRAIYFLVKQRFGRGKNAAPDSAVPDKPEREQQEI
ncbi:MAG: B12-binding domain-containing radical SAM protein [Planctomycetes bacterium]|nr:B12-binding domain-containing radical SAM protein [Planctomycetota bacterium]